MTWNPAPGELRGRPQDVRSRVEPHQGVPAIEKKDALFAPGLVFRGHVQKKRSIVCSKQRFAREIPGQRLRISDRMTAREHELHGFGPSRCLPPSEPILVNKSLPAPVAGVARRPKRRARHRPALERAMMSPGPKQASPVLPTLALQAAKTQGQIRQILRKSVE